MYNLKLRKSSFREFSFGILRWLTIGFLKPDINGDYGSKEDSQQRELQSFHYNKILEKIISNQISISTKYFKALRVQ